MFTVKATMEQCADDLKEYGAAVVPLEEIFSYPDHLALKKVQGVEFVKGANEPVQGAFGAMGHASAFHNPANYDFTQRLYEAMVPLFAVHYKGKVLRILPDRLCCRGGIGKKKTIPGEEAHVDCYSAIKTIEDLNSLIMWYEEKAEGGDQALKEEIVKEIKKYRDLVMDVKIDVVKTWGGWVNLNDDVNQRLPLCLMEKAIGNAFDSKHVDQDAANAALESQRLKQFGNTMQMDCNGCVIVPPNHLLIFEQGMVHKVNKTITKPDVADWRQFIGWQVLEAESPSLNEFVEFCMGKGAVFPLPSGQMPRIYPLMFTNTNLPGWVNKRSLSAVYEDDPRMWGSKTYIPDLLFTKTGTHKPSGKEYDYQLPPPFLPSVSVIGGTVPVGGNKLIPMIAGLPLKGGRKRTISNASTVEVEYPSPKKAQEVL
jgi:hypothetical protein